MVKMKTSKQEAESLVEITSKARHMVLDLMKETKAPGLTVAVSLDGNTIWSEGFGVSDIENHVPCTTKTVMKLASLSKPITMAVTSRLVEAGTLDLDENIQSYVPDWPDKTWDGEETPITARMLASHLAGIRDYKRINKSATSDSSDSHREFDFDEYYITKKYLSVTDSLSIFKDDPLIAKPGTSFHYSTHGFTLLSAVLEGASGSRKFSELIKQLCVTLGMRSTYLDMQNKIIPNRSRYYIKKGKNKLENAPFTESSFKLAGAGMLSTAEDVVRFGNMMLRSYHQDIVDERRRSLIEERRKSVIEERRRSIMLSSVSKSKMELDNLSDRGITEEKDEVNEIVDEISTGGIILNLNRDDKDKSSPTQSDNKDKSRDRDDEGLQYSYSYEYKDRNKGALASMAHHLVSHDMLHSDDTNVSDTGLQASEYSNHSNFISEANEMKSESCTSFSSVQSDTDTEATFLSDANTCIDFSADYKMMKRASEVVEDTINSTTNKVFDELHRGSYTYSNDNCVRRVSMDFPNFQPSETNFLRRIPIDENVRKDVSSSEKPQPYINKNRRRSSISRRPSQVYANNDYVRRVSLEEGTTDGFFLQEVILTNNGGNVETVGDVIIHNTIKSNHVNLKDVDSFDNTELTSDDYSSSKLDIDPDFNAVSYKREESIHYSSPVKTKPEVDTDDSFEMHDLENTEDLYITEHSNEDDTEQDSRTNSRACSNDQHRSSQDSTQTDNSQADSVNTLRKVIGQLTAESNSHQRYLSKSTSNHGSMSTVVHMETQWGVKEYESSQSVNSEEEVDEDDLENSLQDEIAVSYLGSRTVHKLWTPVPGTKVSWFPKGGHYGMGWQIIPFQEYNENRIEVMKGKCLQVVIGKEKVQITLEDATERNSDDTISAKLKFKMDDESLKTNINQKDIQINDEKGTTSSQEAGGDKVFCDISSDTPISIRFNRGEKKERLFENTVYGHTGGTVGASSAFLILPRVQKPPEIQITDENNATSTDRSQLQTGEAEPVQPRGIVIAILCNLQGISMGPFALELLGLFTKMKCDINTM